MAKTRYMLMNESETQVDSNGNKRIDILSFPISDFIQKDVVLGWVLTEMDVYRFDQFIISQYGSTNYYLPMIKWLNGLYEMDDRWIGETIRLYSKSDLDRFLRDNLIKLEK